MSDGPSPTSDGEKQKTLSSSQGRRHPVGPGQHGEKTKVERIHSAQRRERSFLHCRGERSFLQHVTKKGRNRKMSILKMVARKNNIQGRRGRRGMYGFNHYTQRCDQ